MDTKAVSFRRREPRKSDTGIARALPSLTALLPHLSPQGSERNAADFIKTEADYLLLLLDNFYRKV